MSVHEFTELQPDALLNSERYAGLPDGDFSLIAKDQNGNDVLAKGSWTKHGYNCSCCGDSIRKPHVVVTSFVDSDFDHHHMHSGDCFNSVLDTWNGVELVSKADTSYAAIMERKRHVPLTVTKRTIKHVGNISLQDWQERIGALPRVKQ